MPPAADALPVAVAATTKMPKLRHLQILRAIAASMVVIQHTISALAGGGYSVDRYLTAEPMFGATGVVAFFVISGFIMVRQSAPLFGTRSGPAIFAYHRLIRIVPLYWLATLLWVWVILRWNRAIPHLASQVLSSLFFLPNLANAGHQFHPFLEPGWTLNYEMCFYSLFAIGLVLPRRFGIPAILAVLVFLVSALHRHNPLSSGMAGATWTFYTDPLMLFFAVGVVIGAVELKLKKAARFAARVSPAWLLLLPPMIEAARGPNLKAAFTFLELSLYATLVVVLCTICNPTRLGRINRTLTTLGDASYSTYLFHLWSIGWIVPFVTRMYRHFHRPLNHVIPVLIACVLAANLLGLIINRAVERPLVKALRRVNFGPQVPA